MLGPLVDPPSQRGTEGGQRRDATVGAPKGCDGPHRRLGKACDHWGDAFVFFLYHLDR